MAQNDMVLDYLEKNGSITQAEAFERLGCLRLGARVYDLKARGVGIIRNMETGVNRFGVKVSFARYRLKRPTKLTET